MIVYKMIRSLRSLRYWYKVTKKTNGPEGKPLPQMQMFYLTDDEGKELSFWNDIPHNMKGDIVNCCIEVPKQKNNKLQIIKHLKNHPLMQDTKKNVFDKKQELRYYAKFPMFNYGFIPRTWEQTLNKDENGLYGDDDPIDICDLSKNKKQIGDVYRGKVLGSFCLIDQGEVDWKIIVIDAEEAEKENIQGLWSFPRERLQAVQEWFKTIKTFDGKKPNTIAFDEQILSKDATLNIIYNTHVEWKKLVSSSDPIYNQLRRKFHLEGINLEEQAQF